MKKRVRRNPAVASKAILARMNAFAGEIGGLFDVSSPGSFAVAEVIWLLDDCVPVVLKYSATGFRSRRVVRHYTSPFVIEYSDDDIEYKYHFFRSLNDAELTFRRLIQRRQPDPNYAKRRIRELSQTERPVLPNPANFRWQDVENMKKLADSAGADYDDDDKYGRRLVRIIKTSPRYDDKGWLELVYYRRKMLVGRNVGYFVLTAFVRNPVFKRKFARTLRFNSFEDARDAFFHFHNLIWLEPGYAQRRMRELAEQDHPKLPGGKTR